MDTRTFIRDLVPRLTLNACVIDIADDGNEYNIAIAGTSGVIARCHVPCPVVEGAMREDESRQRLETFLKQGADETVVGLPDGRG